MTQRDRSREKQVREWFEYYRAQRSYLQWLGELVSKPLKFPAPDRRRRSDREIPKAA
jgi:hypothetical protein